MIKQQREFIKRSYTPRRKNFWRRDYHEDLLRKLSFEVNKTPLIGDLGYLEDEQLLRMINGCLNKLGLEVYTTEELARPLSLKN